MKEKTLNALKWIVSILNGSNIPYSIGGGMATYLYGSGRNEQCDKLHPGAGRQPAFYLGKIKKKL